MPITQKEKNYSIDGLLILIIILEFYIILEFHNGGIYQMISNIVLGLWTGFFVAFILYILKLFLKYHENRKLRKLFGFNENFSLIVPEFKIREDVLNSITNKIFEYEYPLKHLRNSVNVKSSGLFGYVDVKAANYISELVYNRLIGRSELVSDNKCNFSPNQNFSYIAFGSTNIYFRTIIDQITKGLLLPTILDKPCKFGYGLIVKKVDNRIIKIGVGGNTETGTSGAAFFLANKWEKIVKEFGESSFAILIEVNHEDDISADRIDSVNLDKDNERRINSFFTSNNVLKIIGKDDPQTSYSDICDNNNSLMIHSKLRSFCNFINCKINICNSSFRCSINNNDSDPPVNPNNPGNNEGSGPQGSPSPTDNSEDIGNLGNPQPSDKHDDIENSGDHGTSGHNTCAGISSSFYSNGKNGTSGNAGSQN